MIQFKLIEYSGHEGRFSDHLAAWLTEAGSISIEHTEVIPTPKGGLLVVFYKERSKKSDTKAIAPATQAICNQCRKNTPIPGQKQCEACKKYQDEYRERRKKQNKVRYP